MTTSGASSRSIRDRVAVITGAASGMGRAMAELFAGEGAQVAAIDLTAPEIDGLAGDGQSGEALCIAADVSDPAAVDRAVATVVEQLGPPDILVNNAGISLLAPIDDPGFSEAWERTLAVNLTAHTSTIRACLPHLARNGEGRIVNISRSRVSGARRS